MEIPRNLLANMMQPPMPRYFAEGGPVTPGGGSFREGSSTVTAGGITFNFPIDGSSLLSQAVMERTIGPFIERKLKQAGVLPR
jgi:hypothetical protein